MISLIIVENDIQVDIDAKADEPLSLYTWSELYRNAQKHHLPYYWMSVVVIRVADDFVGQCYDGVCLHKSKLVHESSCRTPFLSPLTRSEIFKIHHIFFNCFDFENLNSPTVLSFPTISTFQFSNLPQELHALSMVGLNGFAAQNAHLKKTIGQAQCVVGVSLLQANDDAQLESVRWIWSSAQQGIGEAVAIYKKTMIMHVR
jgi:hypothetical protein